MDITIKKMETDEEIRGKAYVHWASWHAAYTGLIDQAYLDKLTLEKCVEIAYQWPDNILVAKDGERVIGFVGAGTYRDRSVSDTGEIFALYVLKEYYGTGVGKILTDAAIATFSDYPTVILWVLKGNGRAIRFYEKCGFRADGEEKALPALRASEIRMIYEREACK